MKNNLNSSSEVSDLLINSDFIRLFKSFVDIYDINDLFDDDKTLNFLDKISEFNYKKEELNNIFSKTEILYNLWFIFSYEEILSQFLEYINYSNIDKKLLDSYLEIGDYLMKIYSDKDMYPNNMDVESNRLKDKVGDILWKSEIDNISLLIAKNNFPTIWKKWFPIVEIDFKNMIDFYGDGNIDLLFVKVKDSEWNIFYHNYKWDILLCNDWKEIIDIEYIYYFKWYSILKLKTNDLKTSFEIRSKEWKSFDVPSWLSDILPWKLVDWENELDFLILSKEINWINKTTLFNIDWETITLMELIRFVNIWKPSTIQMLEKSLSKFNDIDVSYIKWIKTIWWAKFIELSLDYEYVEEWEESSYDVIMLDSWVPLTNDNWEYIKKLFDFEEFLWKKLLGIGFTLFSIEWFIDSNWKTFTINDQLVYNIDNTNLNYKGEDMYIINNDKDFIVSKSIIEKSLANLLWFNEIQNDDVPELEYENWFTLFFEEDDNFILKNKKIDQLSFDKDNWDLSIFLYSNWVSESLSYRELIDELKKDKKYFKILNQINILMKK